MKSHWLAVALLILVLPELAVAQGQVRKIEVRATGDITFPADELSLALELTTSGDHFKNVKERNDQLLESMLDLVDAHKLTQPAIEATTASFDFLTREPRHQFPSSKGRLVSLRVVRQLSRPFR